MAHARVQKSSTSLEQPRHPSQESGNQLKKDKIIVAKVRKSRNAGVYTFKTSVKPMNKTYHYGWQETCGNDQHVMPNTVGGSRHSLGNMT